MKYKLSVLICALFLVVLAGTFVFGFEQITESEIEGRAMTTFGMVLDPVEDENSVIYNAKKSASDRFEDAMKDQIRIRREAVAFYMDMDSRSYNLFDDFCWWIGNNGRGKTEQKTESDDAPDFEKYPGYGRPILEKVGNEQLKLKKAGNDLYRLDDTDWLVNATNTTNGDDKTIQQSIDQLAALQNKYGLNVFGYFVSHASDTPWFEEYLGVTWADRAEHIAQMAPDTFRFSRVAFKDLADYKARNYKTDHHWSNVGIRKGYEDIYAMMSRVMDIGAIKEPVKTWDFTELYGVEYRGSRAKTLQNTYDAYDAFIVDEYDGSGRECFVLDPKKDLFEEIPARFGLWEEYKAGNIRTDRYFDHYIRFYGTATALDDGKTTYADSSVLFGTRNTDGEYSHNLLMVGDSNMRAIRDVMAMHFGTTLYLDYRINGLENASTGIPQPYVDELIERYDIDTILIVTQRSNYWANNKHTFLFSPSFSE